MSLTGGAGVDIVYDPVGMIIPSLKCVAWNARLVVVGFVAGSIEKVPANLALLKQVSITGLAFGQTYCMSLPPSSKAEADVE
jgi:NADPH2:quinone reductase